MEQLNYKILLEWYEKEGDAFLGEEQICLTDEELAERMGFKEKYPSFVGGSYPIKKKDLKVLQPLVNHKIELDKYDYFVCSRSIGYIEPRHVKYLDTGAWKVMKMVFKDLQKHKDIKCMMKEDYVIGFILDVLKENKILSQDSLESLSKSS